MKTTNHFRPNHRAAFRRRAPLTTSDITGRITERHGEVLSRLATTLRHPRSLARPVASWRPVTLPLPSIAGLPALSATVTRHRVGPRAKARVRGYDGEREPAYVVSLRLTDPTGSSVDPALGEAWVRALVGEDHVESVHEIDSSEHATYVWLVDGRFVPVTSPATLFTGFTNAA